MNTKYEYYAIGSSVFHNNNDTCIMVVISEEYPSIQYLEEYSVRYHEETWKTQIVEINKKIFDFKFLQVMELIKSKSGIQ